MSVPSGKMLVFVGEKYACIKLVGRATFTSSVDFKTLIDELQRKGYMYFVLDLSECLLMDSTFLGVLAGFGLKITVPQGGQSCGMIELFKPSPRVTELLENLGVLHLFKLTQGDTPCAEKTEPHDHSPGHASTEEVTRTCLEAHQTLMKINPDNVSRFKDVAQFLAEDLKKLQASK